jgi:hypothetical protein
MGNRQMLWHGTGVANVISMLSRGLQIKPSGAEQAGSAFGEGLYFANRFSKSRNYCRTHHGGLGVMLLCDVAMGDTLQSSPQDWADNVKIARHIASQKASGVPVWETGHKCLARRSGSGQWQKARVQSISATAGCFKICFLDHSCEPVGDPVERKENELLPTQSTSDSAVIDLQGTSFNSTHIMSASAPAEDQSVVHPAGASMPIGDLVPREQQTQHLASADEIVVYNRSQARVCYVVELCEQTHGAVWKDTALCKISK